MRRHFFRLQQRKTGVGLHHHPLRHPEVRRFSRLALNLLRQLLYGRGTLGLQLGAVALLTDLVVQPAGFAFLIRRMARALAFGSGQRGARRAVPVPPVTLPADHHFAMTSLAVEGPAWEKAHL